MIETKRALGGMITSPHHLASQAGLDVLQQGGDAIEAAVAVAATLAVVYPHMTGIGGDGFWLVRRPGETPVAIDACGRSAKTLSVDFYASRGLSEIPRRGPLAANTVAGTVSGWEAALKLRRGARQLDLERILERPIYYAKNGMVVTRSQSELTNEKLAELSGLPGFAANYLAGGSAPAIGSVLKQPALARTLRALAVNGLDDFYSGQTGRSIAADLARAGSPVTIEDLEDHSSSLVEPLAVKTSKATCYNLPPPTQGLSSLMILGLFDRFKVDLHDTAEYIHLLVESTKQAFLVRDRHVFDPQAMTCEPRSFLESSKLDELASRIKLDQALLWPHPSQGGDTVWLGVVDQHGCAVSFIQSIYYEFGSGVVLPDTGICWQNRGASFRVANDGWNAVAPGRKPFHTLNPAMALFHDGREMVYGTMGGEGQPQTQAAVFTRYAYLDQQPQEAITSPRWLLGKTWGDESVTLKLEDRFDAATVSRLRDLGHNVELVNPFTSMMGHAGAIVRKPDGVLEGAADPRSDGVVAAW